MKTQLEEFDPVILGGGTGSTVAAWTFAGEGKQVAVVDRKYIGGSCPNIACLPSKNIIHSAKVASYFRRSKEFGITLDDFAIDMADVRERKRNMVRGLNDMVPMETNLRARTLSETRGFVKALVEADSDRILGFTAFGVGAGQTLAAVQMAMIAGLPYTALRDAVLTHPTLVEGLISLFSSAPSAHNVVETRRAHSSTA